ncbi:hypothetical protein ACFQGE_18665 [Halomicroarcula sp. GCM10025817]|uniref:hypothetical protein n=1 Tax=Haloarcula TaxID=2237 RepID=UPI0023E80765|nr:hypothetical protein [Halomicroarcula sp. SYNS111]
MLLQSLIEVLRAYAGLVLPLVFFGFFAVAGLALLFNRHPEVRRTFAVGFVVVFLLCQVSLVPLTVPPLTTYHKFSNTWDQERVEYEFRVVDENGQELRFDAKSTLEFEGIRMSRLHHQMLTEYSEEENRVVARFLLQSAREYRGELEAGGGRNSLVWSDGGVKLRHATNFPAHGHVTTWTPAELSQYGEFVGLRLYRVEIESSADGSEVVSQSEAVVFEYYDEGEPGAAAELEARDVR